MFIICQACCLRLAAWRLKLRIILNWPAGIAAGWSIPTEKELVCFLGTSTLDYNIIIVEPCTLQ